MIVTQICACGILMPSERARALQYARRRRAARRGAVRPCGNGCSDATRGETTRRGRPLQLRPLSRRPARSRVYVVAGGRCTRGVMGNVHAVDSYCFVIGLCDGTCPRYRATRRRILHGGRFIGNFPRPTSGFPRFSRSRGRDDACQRGAFPRSLSPGARFCAFFLLPFCILSFFFCKRRSVKSGASE